MARSWQNVAPSAMSSPARPKQKQRHCFTMRRWPAQFAISSLNLAMPNHQPRSRLTTPQPTLLSINQWDINAPNRGTCDNGGWKKSPPNQNLEFSGTKVSTIGRTILLNISHPVYIQSCGIDTCIKWILFYPLLLTYLHVTYLRGCVSPIPYQVRTDTCQTRWRVQFPQHNRTH